MLSDQKPPRADATQRLDRALGAYLGLAIGDALGATVEFMPPERIAQVYGVHRHIIGGGWLNLAKGAVTDDTEMSLALGDAIVRRGGFELRAVADGFAAWLRADPVDCGSTCRRGITRYLRDASLVAPPRESAAGNGALMRNLPVVLCSMGDDALLSDRTLSQCHVTHNHRYSDAAALAFARMTAALVDGASMPNIRAIADELVRAYDVFEFAGYCGPATGYVVDTVRTVLCQFFTAGNFEGTLVGTVNRGDDADTTGALAGMLAGARFGRAAIPERWLSALNREVRARIELQTRALLALAPRPDV